MKAIDIIILIPLLWGAYKGFSRGLLMELATIIGFVLATIVGFHFMDQSIQWLKPYLDDYPEILPFAGFISVFIVVLICVTLLAKLLKSVLDITLIGVMDDVAGAILGVLKWGFVISVVCWLIHQSSFQLPYEFVDGAVIYPVMLSYAPGVIDAVAWLMPFAEDLVDSINEVI